MAEKHPRCVWVRLNVCILGSLVSIHWGCIHFDVRRLVLNVFFDMLVRSSHCGVGWEIDHLVLFAILSNSRSQHTSLGLILCHLQCNTVDLVIQDVGRCTT